MAELQHDMHASGSTGNSRAYVRGLARANRIEIEMDVTAVGATPTITWEVQGLVPDGDPTVDADWVTLALSSADSSAAASSAPVVATTVSKVRRYVAGLPERFFDAYAIKTTANTNVTYRSRLRRQDF